MQRSLSGSFRLDRPNSGWWRVRNTESPHEVVWLRNRPAPDRGHLPEEPSLPAAFTSLRLEWSSPDFVTAVLGDGAAARTLTVDSVQLQEPDARLYHALPLARFTPEAKRFWRRIFWLVRLPGGRSLLRLVARRRA